MNKEVEEAKEWLKDKREYYRARMKDYEKDNCLTAFYYEIKKDETIMKTLLNYIQELEESIYKERELAEAQTTYDINEIWKEKIENRVKELEELFLDPLCAKNVQYRIYELDRLLGKVKNNE